MENKYKEGETVYPKRNPSLRLIVRRYVAEIYYCKIADKPSTKELVFFERELMPDPGDADSITDQQ